MTMHYSDNGEDDTISIVIMMKAMVTMVVLNNYDSDDD